jgi:hypothetical protein
VKAVVGQGVAAAVVVALIPGAGQALTAAIFGAAVPAMVPNTLSFDSDPISKQELEPEIDQSETEPNNEQQDNKTEGKELEDGAVGGEASSEQDKKKRRSEVVCKSQPEIENRDEALMEGCVGTEAGDTCSVQCADNYSPTKKEVKCVDAGKTGEDEGTWFIDGASCVDKEHVICRDEKNEPVNWSILYRLPQKSPVTGGAFENKEDNFLFISDKMDHNWIHVQWEPLDNTLAPIRKEHKKAINDNDNDKLVYVMYSDQAPDSKVVGDQAHAKGKQILNCSFTTNFSNG